MAARRARRGSRGGSEARRERSGSLTAEQARRLLADTRRQVADLQALNDLTLSVIGSGSSEALLQEASQVIGRFPSRHRVSSASLA